MNHRRFDGNSRGRFQGFRDHHRRCCRSDRVAPLTEFRAVVGAWLVCLSMGRRLQSNPPIWVRIASGFDIASNPRRQTAVHLPCNRWVAVYCIARPTRRCNRLASQSFGSWRLRKPNNRCALPPRHRWRTVAWVACIGVGHRSCTALLPPARRYRCERRVRLGRWKPTQRLRPHHVRVRRLLALMPAHCRAHARIR